MSSKTQKIPSIRFKGFTDAWEQRKLKDLALFNPKSILPEEFEYVDLESVSGTTMVSHRTEKNGNAPSRAQRLAIKGDVFYQTVRPYQKNNYLFDLPYDNYVFSTGYAQLRPYGDSYFLLSRLQEERFVLNVLDRSTGTSYPAINSNDLAQIEINVPFQTEEQSKIGDFFKQLDNIIALHQRQMDNYKELKKTSMQKIFNQELRFKDKNGNDYPVWQKKKLKDLGKFYSGTGFNDKYQGYLDLSIPFFKVSDMNIASNSKYMVESNNTVDDDICREMKINKITGPAILFAKVGAAIYMERKRIVHNDFLMDNNMMALRINDSVDIEFTYYLCQSLSFSKYAQVGALPSYNASDIGRLHCKLPVISEQKKIAIFLSTLDQKVNEAAQKVELFKELKKGLMQQMFF